MYSQRNLANNSKEGNLELQDTINIHNLYSPGELFAWGG